jgi:predicted amidohydrolase
MKVALVQMLVEGGKAEENLERAGRRIESAAALGADLVLLPEALDFGWTHPSARDGAGTIPGGESFVHLSRSAARNGVFVCAGLIEKDGDLLYNSSVLLDREGRLLAKHRKINELDIARDLYTNGSEPGSGIDTEFGTIGLQICADGFAEGQWISRKLCERGAGIMLSPCAWAVDADFDPVTTPYGDIWRNNFSPVAREFGCWFVACSNVGWIEEGPWKGKRCIGNSMVFDSEGKKVLTASFGEDADEIRIVEIPA